jgi:transcription initiation factor IIE alpha subunit
MDEIHLPDEFRCPVCDGRLELFRYRPSLTKEIETHDTNEEEMRKKGGRF